MSAPHFRRTPTMPRALPVLLLVAINSTPMGAARLGAAEKPAVGPQVEQTTFGTMPDGKTVITSYTLSNRHGLSATVIDYGGIVTAVRVPGKDGKFADVALGFDDLAGYLKGHPYFGSNAGRCANRIAKGKFTLDGKQYTLATNNGPNHLHGGDKGFDKKVWRGEPFMGAAGPGVRFTYTSPDGEEGYPGNLAVTISYTLTNDNELVVEYQATTDKPTVCNLAHHSYFN